MENKIQELHDKSYRLALESCFPYLQELLYDLYYNINCVIFSLPIRFTPNLQKSIWYWIERKEEKFLLFQKKLILHQLCSVMITKEWQKKQKNTYATTHDRD